MPTAAASQRSATPRLPRWRPTPGATGSSRFAPTSGSAHSGVVLRYCNLVAVEDTRTAKALLATRPIFHKAEAGIRGHSSPSSCVTNSSPASRPVAQDDRVEADRRRPRRSLPPRGRAGRQARPPANQPVQASMPSAAPSASPCDASTRRPHPPPEPVASGALRIERPGKSMGAEINERPKNEGLSDGRRRHRKAANGPFPAASCAMPR
jgi:hypothetical protein